MNGTRTSANSAEENTTTKIIIIATYFGEWPVWFPAFLLSCARNDTINWLFFTDCEIPKETFPNIKFERMGLGQLNGLASQKLGIRIQKEPFSQVDLQPAFGVIFEDYIKNFDFWGHCDIDVVWGNIRGFITEEIFQNYDIISFRKEFLAGHLTLWKNEHRTNTLFTNVPSYDAIFSSSECYSFDEAVISVFLKTQMAADINRIRVYWPEDIVPWFVGRNTPIGWYWENGKLFDARQRERVYLHYQTWKKQVMHIDFQVGDTPERFVFTRFGIRARRQPGLNLLDQQSVLEDLKGLVEKSSNEFGQSLRLAKRIWPVRNFYWAQKLAINTISARDVQYDRKTGGLYLKRFDLCLKEQHHFFLDSYYWALQLVDHQQARFYSDEQNQLYVEVAKLRAIIQNAEEILILKRLLVDGFYNVLLSRPAVVLDIGMHVGLTSVFFASQPDVVVVGCEPCQQTYSQALRNIALNRGLSDKIRTVKVGAGASKYRTIAGYIVQTADLNGRIRYHEDDGMGPEFKYEEIDIEDVAGMIDSICADYPGREIAIKIDLKRSEYYIDGISEYSLVDRLRTSGKLNLIDTIMLKWHRRKPADEPAVIAHQLSDCGFNVFRLAPHYPNEGMLYAVRRN